MIFYFSEIEERLKYSKNKNKFQNNLHNGQLKLLLNEINFFNQIDIINYCKNKDEINILYIGSGKGFHIPILINCLRAQINNNIKWYFYDPRGHCNTLENWDNGINIKVKKKLFLEKDINEFKKKKNILFISDIRSSKQKEPTTLDLLRDYKLQNNILKYIKPDYSLLKCRYPFPDDWNDNYKLEMPLGIEFIQPFSPIESCELRLFVKGNSYIFKTIVKEILEIYEEKMFWYNIEYRIQSENDKKIALYIIDNMDDIIKNNLTIQNKSSDEILKFFSIEIEKEKNKK